MVQGLGFRVQVCARCTGQDAKAGLTKMFSVPEAASREVIRPAVQNAAVGGGEFDAPAKPVPLGHKVSADGSSRDIAKREAFFSRCI